jgi:glycosyltransferase involved in cell wall biosynthesis
VTALRFCLLTTFYPPAGFGGDAIQVERLAHALADDGHEVTVVHAPGAYRALAGRPPAPPREHPGVRVIADQDGASRLPAVASHLAGRPLLTTRRLRSILEQDFDVVHFHNPSLLGGPGLLRMGTGLKLYTAHEQWLTCPTHVLWKYQRRVCEAPQCWRCAVTYKRPPQLWRSGSLLERSVAQLDALIVPSRTSAELHARFASTTRIEELAHFVPQPRETRDTPATRDDAQRPYFLVVGRLEPIKGVGSVIDAFRRRRSEDLVIAGTGTLEPALRTQAADLPHVRFLGWREGAELDALYRGALGVIVPTLGHESFGIVAVEAFARGKPVLLHRFGALAELAAPDRALTYAGEDELVAGLARIAESSALRERLSERGRAAYLREWTPERHLTRYLGLIDELARGRRAAAPVSVS